MRLIVFERQRIGDAAALEGDAVLPLPIGMILDLADGELVGAAALEMRVEQRRDVGRLHIAVTDPAIGRLDFDQRLQP